MKPRSQGRPGQCAISSPALQGREGQPRLKLTVAGRARIPSSASTSHPGDSPGGTSERPARQVTQVVSGPRLWDSCWSTSAEHACVKGPHPGCPGDLVTATRCPALADHTGRRRLQTQAHLCQVVWAQAREQGHQIVPGDMHREEAVLTATTSAPQSTLYMAGHRRKRLTLAPLQGATMGHSKGKQLACVTPAIQA